MLPNGTPETRRVTNRRIAAAIILAAVLLVLAIAPGLRSDKFQPAIDPYPAPYTADAVDDGSDSAAPTQLADATPAPAINPFSGPSVAGDHLVRLEMNDGVGNVVLSTETDVVAEAVGEDLLASYARSPIGELAGGTETLDVDAGNLPRIGGTARTGNPAGGGGFPTSGAGGARSSNASELSAAGADDGSFVFRPDDNPSGTDDDTAVSMFPANNGLTILADDSDAGLGAPGAQLLLDEDIELVHAPEPATLLLLGSGLVAIAHRLRKRGSPVARFRPLK